MQEGIKMAHILANIKECGCSKITIMSYCVYDTCICKTNGNNSIKDCRKC